MVIMNPSFSNDVKTYRKTGLTNMTADNVGISLRGETTVDHELTSESGGKWSDDNQLAPA